MKLPRKITRNAGVLALGSGLAMLNFGLVMAPTPAATQQAGISASCCGSSKCSGRCEGGVRGSCFCCSGLCWVCGDEC